MILLKKTFKHMKQGTMLQVIKSIFGKLYNYRKREWIRLKNKGAKSHTFNLHYFNCGNYKINLDFDNAISEKIYIGHYEPDEVGFVYSFLRQKDIFIDIGANVGLYSVIGGHRVGDGGKVFAFEPVKKTFDRMRYNIQLNSLKNVYCFKLALSDKIRKYEIVEYLDGYDAWSTLAGPVENNRNYILNKVQATTLDSLINSGSIPCNISLVKIDVEGWESNVLHGGTELFSKPDAPVLIIEFTSKNAIQAGSSCQEVYLYLEKLGYSMYSYNRIRNLLTHDPMREFYPYNNLIAIKDINMVSSRIGGKVLKY